MGEAAGLDVGGLPFWAQSILNEPVAVWIAGIAVALVLLRLMFKR